MAGIIYRCFACCVGELCWEGDFMRSELGEGDEDHDGVVNILHCQNCGAEVRVYHRIDDEDT